MDTLVAKTKRAVIGKQVHQLSGITLSAFIGIHFMNHLAAVGGAEVHIMVMDILRKMYRNPLIEIILLLSVGIQIVTGGVLLFRKKFRRAGIFDKLQVLSGFYLALFLLYHTGVVLTARFLWDIDTNFYFAAGGPASYPACLFFIPYYSLSVMAVFVHIACVHRAKMKERQHDATKTAYVIMGAGFFIAALIIFTFSGGLYPV